MTDDPQAIAARLSPAQKRGYEVMSRPCDQCLLTPQRIVSGPRAAQIIRDTRQKDCAFICHKGSIAGRDIACRAHYDKTGGGQMARIARRLNMIVEVDPDILAKEPAHDRA